MKKILTLFLFLFLLENCGYSPMYSKNQKTDFYIQSIDFDDGDSEMASFIKTNLSNYFTKNAEKSFIINTKIKYQKTPISKTAEAITEEYNLNSMVTFQIKSENFNKTLVVNETSKMDNFNDEFEEKQYERTIKKNMARSIVSKLLIQLSRFNVN